MNSCNVLAQISEYTHIMSLNVLFGNGDWERPWYQYDNGTVKEVSQDALDFLHKTVGLHGLYHDQHGYIVDMKLWAGIVQYVRWCIDENTDFLFHVDMVQQGDDFYTALATAKMSSLVAS